MDESGQAGSSSLRLQAMADSATQTPRRSYLTILFTDLAGSTGIAADLETEDYAELLERVRAICEAAIPRRGGTMVQVSGDGLVAIFGYPRPSEDDARHAIDSALEIHERVRAVRLRHPPVPLAMHSGIHSGLVLLRRGDTVHGRFELLGNATNIASRLASAANGDEILVSEMTLGPKRALYQVSERRVMQLRGTTEPIAVHRVLARAPTSAVSRRGASFIGRESELAVLTASLGEPARLAIVGSPGMGKTRLAEELLVRAAERGHPVHRGECGSSGGAVLQPIRQIVRSLLALDPALPPGDVDGTVGDRLAELGMPAAKDHHAIATVLAAGGDRPAPAHPHAAVHLRLADTLRRLLELTSRDAPPVFFIDDWQWADDATRRLVAKLSDQLPPATLLLAARGAADLRLAGVTVLALAPFDEGEVGAKVAQLVPTPDPALTGEIAAYSGGNPLFIEELCHLAREGRDIGRRRITGRGWLDMLIASRFGQLAAGPATLIEIAAVIGTSMPAALFERVSGHGRIDPAVRALADADFLFLSDDGQTLRFKHGLTRDAIYEAIGLGARRELHRRVAAALEEAAAGAGDAETDAALAHHYGAAGDDARAVHHAELAGDAALAASALDRAEAQYRAALAALDRLPRSDENDRRTTALLERLGLAAVYDPSTDHLDLYRHAVAQADQRGDAVALATARHWLAYVEYALGEGRAAIAECERVIALAADNPIRIVQAQTVLGQACAATGDYDRALSLLNESLPVRRQQFLGSRASVGTAYALACRAAVLADMGAFSSAQACFAQALDALGGASHEVEGSVLCWWSAVCLWQGHLQDALAHAQAAELIARRVRTRYVSAMSQALAGFAGWRLRRNVDALAALQSATHSRANRGGGLFLSLNHGWLASALAEAGRPGEARAHAALALVCARRHDRLGEAMACRAMARAAAAGTGRRAAAHYLARADAAAIARRSPHESACNRYCEAELAAAGEDRRQALDLLDTAQAAFSAMDMRWHLTRAEGLRARLG